MEKHLFIPGEKNPRRCDVCGFHPKHHFHMVPSETAESTQSTKEYVINKLMENELRRRLPRNWRPQWPVRPATDYCSDLNAMYRAEQFLTVEEVISYSSLLVDAGNESPDQRYPAHGWTFHMPPATRARCWLQAIGKL